MKIYCAIVMLVALSFALILVDAGDTKGDEGEKCGRHEKWDDCGSIPPNCIKTCATRNLQFKCVAVCNPGCYCEDGYIRRDKNGPCIRECECPKSEEEE